MPPEPRLASILDPPAAPPKGWTMAPLADYCTIVGGGTPDTKEPTFWGGEIPWASPTEMTALRGRYIAKTERTITRAGLKASNAKLIPAGSLILTSRATIGASAISTIPLATNQGFQSLVPKPNCDVEFLYYLIQSERQRLVKVAEGSTFLELKPTDFASMKFNWPPLAEQRRIAALHSSIDETTSANVAIQTQAHLIRKTLLPEQATRGNWPTQTLGELCVGKLEYGANAAAVEFDVALPRYLRITDILPDGTLSRDSKKSIPSSFAADYLLRPGSVLFARSGATVGKTFLVRGNEGPLAFAGYLIRAVPNPAKLLPEFLFHFTRSPLYESWVQSMLRAGAQPNINAKEYSSLQIPLPPISAQSRIAAVLDMVMEVERLAKQTADALMRQKIAIQRSLLIGGLS